MDLIELVLTDIKYQQAHHNFLTRINDFTRFNAKKGEKRIKLRITDRCLRTGDKRHITYQLAHTETTQICLCTNHNA